MFNISPQFKKILDSNQRLSGIVYTTLSDFEDIIRVSQLEFFPEYTNHGIDHIENVLSTAEAIIHKDSFKYLTPYDVAILILSVLLHDLGMHITHESLMSLIYGNLKDQKVEFFDELSWYNEWDNFYSEAKRFGDKKLKALFGEIRAVEQPNKSTNDLTKYDKMLYGEFIRKTHPRLAHEIAIHGFPAKDNNNIEFARGMDQQLKDIVGLIARSHGIDIRSTFEYLENKFDKYNWHVPLDIHIVFLMVVLRIADYLHITSERAPSCNLSIRNISSPISQKEWNLHNCIKQITTDTNDPESVFIFALPENSETYIRLDDLLKSIQYELDISWAVLGEVYGRFEGLNELKLRIRRIKSNISNKRDFSKKIGYIPEKITFDADPELLKLLVRPLYSGHPSYGIRELIQNAVDACRELQYILGNQVDYCNYKLLVELKIEECDNKDFYLVITDNGIGMNKNILKNYFFKAGASFRKSDVWQKNFSDLEGHSTIQRSGRFGVGVLAAFLLGNSIQVTTRYFDSPPDEGLEFYAEIDTEQIEVRKVTKNQLGTTIRIKLSKNSVEKLIVKNIRYSHSDFLSYDEKAYPWFEWYQLNNPELRIITPKDWANINIENLVPDVNDKLSLEWHSIYPKGFKKVNWSYNEQEKVLCNGIVIPKGYKQLNSFFPPFENYPCISIFDFDGNLPLTLNRNSIDIESLPDQFKEMLSRDICKDIVAKLLVVQQKNISSISNSIIVRDLSLQHPALANKTYGRSHFIDNTCGCFIINKDGYYLSYPSMFEKNNSMTLTIVYLKDSHDKNIDLNHQMKNVIFWDKPPVSIRDFKYEIFLNESIKIAYTEYEIASKTILMQSSQYDYLFDKSYKRVAKDIKASTKVTQKSKNWTYININNSFEPDVDLKTLDQYSDSVEVIVRYYISGIKKTENFKGMKLSNYNINKDVLADVLKEYIGDDFLIPFSQEERKLKYPKAFKELEIYMQKYINAPI